MSAQKDTISYQSAFFIVPARIMNLAGLTLTYLKVYETIFQFWNHGKDCYLSTSAIMLRINVSSDSVVREAFAFFEKHNELKRITKNGRRYLQQPSNIIEIDEKSTKKHADTPAATATPPRRNCGAPPAATAAHNINNINNKNLTRESARKKRVPLPQNYQPSQPMMVKAIQTSSETNVPVDKLIAKFKLLQERKEATSFDWDKDFELFLLNEKPAFTINTLKREEDAPRSAVNRMKEHVSRKNIIGTEEYRRTCQNN